MYYIKPAKGYLTSLFSNSRKNPALPDVIRPHQGIDIGGDSDNAIIAAAAGKVRFVESNPKRTGFGYYLVISHDNGQETLYAHLSKIDVRVNQFVKQGQKIGVKGTTGNSTGVHLHFEISKSRWTNFYANKIDPLTQFTDPVTLEMQKKLNKLGYGELAEDGIYGDGTISAVSRFQKTCKLEVDGVAGQVTVSEIEKACKSLTPTIVKPESTKDLEVDEMAELLPITQQEDMKNLLQKAFDVKIFSVNHSGNVKTMTRGQATDLMISYVARKE